MIRILPNSVEHTLTTHSTSWWRKCCALLAPPTNFILFQLNSGWLFWVGKNPFPWIYTPIRPFLGNTPSGCLKWKISYKYYSILTKISRITLDRKAMIQYWIARSDYFSRYPGCTYLPEMKFLYWNYIQTSFDFNGYVFLMRWSVIMCYLCFGWLFWSPNYRGRHSCCLHRAARTVGAALIPPGFRCSIFCRIKSIIHQGKHSLINFRFNLAENYAHGI